MFRLLRELLSACKETDGGPHREGFTKEIKFDLGHEAWVDHFQVRACAESREEGKNSLSRMKWKSCAKTEDRKCRVHHEETETSVPRVWLGWGKNIRSRPIALKAFIKLRLYHPAEGSHDVKPEWAGKWHENTWHVSKPKTKIPSNQIKTSEAEFQALKKDAV